MQEPKYTPGPLEITNKPRFTRYAGIETPHDCFSIFPENAPHSGGDFTWYAIAHGIEKRADAELFAAAPEMWELLREMTKAFEPLDANGDDLQLRALRLISRLIPHLEENS